MLKFKFRCILQSGWQKGWTVKENKLIRVNFVVHGIVIVIKNVRIEVIKGFIEHPLFQNVYDRAVLLVPFTFLDIVIVVRFRVLFIGTSRCYGSCSSRGLFLKLHKIYITLQNLHNFTRLHKTFTKLYHTSQCFTRLYKTLQNFTILYNNFFKTLQHFTTLYAICCYKTLESLTKLYKTPQKKR